MTKFMKFLAFLMLIAGIIVSIVVADSSPIANAMYNEYLKADIVVSKSFNFSVFIFGCIASLFPFGILFTLGSMHGLLERIASASFHAEASPNPTAASASNSDSKTVGCWQCGAENTAGRVFCKVCGKRL